MTAMYNALIQEGQDINEMFCLSETDGAHSEYPGRACHRGDTI